MVRLSPHPTVAEPIRNPGMTLKSLDPRLRGDDESGEALRPEDSASANHNGADVTVDP